MPKAIKCQVQRQTGTYGSPTWNECTAIADCKLDHTKSEFEITTREELGAEVFDVTTEKYQYSGKFRVPKQGNTDSDYEAFRDCYYSGTPIELVILDGPLTTVGSEGVRGYFLVSQWNQDENNKSSLFREFVLLPTISPTAGEKALRRARVGTGPALTYADIGSGSFA